MKKIRLMGSSSSSSDSVSSSSDPSMKRVDQDQQKDITDDIWSEVFLHLPLNSIFKFRCVSKVWLSILSNPNFINKWYQLNNLSLPWAFVSFANHSLSHKFKSLYAIAYPQSYSRFMSHHQIGFSFSFLNPNDELYIMGSSNGLVLCTTCSYNPITHYVCDPLTQKSVLLPLPPSRGCAVTGVICGEFCSSSLFSKSYKVIRIPELAAAAKEFKVEVFSSDPGEWNVVGVSCTQYATWDMSLYNNHFTHNGVFYWFQQRNRNILAIDMNGNTNHGTSDIKCRLIYLPDEAVDGEIDHISECVGESEGLICFARFQEMEMSLSVWVLDGDWYMLNKDIQLHDWLVEMDSQFFGGLGAGKWIRQFGVAGFSPVDKNVVILGSMEYIWAYNIKTRVYELLSHLHMHSSVISQSRLQYFNHFLRVTHGSWMFKCE